MFNRKKIIASLNLIDQLNHIHYHKKEDIKIKTKEELYEISLKWFDDNPAPNHSYYYNGLTDNELQQEYNKRTDKCLL